jgi:AraC family transcriptional regulator of adaptative response / DNA-3-methyladenine glycosylase II
LEKNVDYAFSAIEAMNKGYRPCLRCRPDSSPYSYAWQGVKTTAQRAAKMLVEAPHQSIDKISERLGISARYLHKLMLAHFDIPPKKYRVFHQVLMAKRLLHYSNMSVEQVAHGVGFNSARQLQTHIKSVTGLTPLQIRQSKRVPMQTPQQDNMIIVHLQYQGPYDWPALRDFFAKRLIQGNEKISEHAFTKTFSINGDAVEVTMRYMPKQSYFELDYSHEYVHHCAQIISMASRILDISANPSVIAPALELCGLQSAQIRPGLRIPGICSRFEAGVRAILGQQVSVTAAISQVNKLHAALSPSAHEFVSPHTLSQSDLACIKLPETRKNALRSFAKLMHEDPNADFEKWLAIKGIGPWTVNYVNLRATDNPDVWLDTDLVIRQRLKALAEAGQAIDADKCAPWRSYLTFSLWNLEL